MNDLSVLARAPAYLQIRDLLMARMQAGEWRPHQALPNEVQLANAFRVSVGTIRKAMDALSNLGLVDRQQGRGTFVRDVSSADEFGILNAIRDASGAAIAWDPARIEIDLGSASPEEAVKLDRSQADCDVLRLTWLRSRSRRALAVEKSVVPVDTGVNVDRARHAQDLGELYSRAGILIVRSEDNFRIAVPDAATAERLHVPIDRPLQHVFRKYFDLRGAPVGTSSAWLALKDEHYACTRWASHACLRSG